MGTTHKRKINYLKLTVLLLLSAIIVLSLVLAVKSCSDKNSSRDHTSNENTPVPSASDVRTDNTPDPDAMINENTAAPVSDTPAQGDATDGPLTDSPEVTETPGVTLSPSPAASDTPSPTPTQVPAPTASPTPVPAQPSATDKELMAKEHKAPASPSGVTDVIISEIMSSNTKYIPSEGGCYDWVELYNASDSPVDLSSYSISDRLKKPDKGVLPSVTLRPGEYYVVLCSGETKTGHAPFKLSGGESVYLFKDGERTDEVEIPADLKTDTTYGRYGTDQVYCVVPTPGSANSAGRYSLLSPPSSNVRSGVYTSAVTVSLYASGDIYYTLDGKAPGTSSKKYTGSITITKPTSIRAIAVKDGEISGESDFTYIVDAKTSLLPVLNVSADLESLKKGVFLDQHQPYKGTEEEVLLTFIENGEEQFSVPCGFKLHGNDTRLQEKQNFRIRFKSKYGVSKLRYKLFDDLNITEFDSLVLKGGSEDWYRAIIRDELAADVARNTNLYVQDFRPCILYIGGEYWGIYFIRERLDEDYVASHLDTDAESVDIIKSCGELDAGSFSDYNELREYIKKHSGELLDENSAAYKYVMSKIDYIGLIDWFLCRAYLGDQDISNHRVFKARNADDIWHYTFYDLDWSANPGRENHKTFRVNAANTKDPFFLGLIYNKDFQNKLMTRAAELMETTLNGSIIIEKINRIAETIASEEPRDTVRWNRRESSWESYLNGLRGFFANGVRDAAFKQDLKEYIELIN